MAPLVTKWSDLYAVYEAFGINTHDFLYTTFSVLDSDDDVFYFGQLNIPKLQITYEQFTTALQRIPDQDIYPEIPSDARLTLAPDNLNAGAYYIKRPRLNAYEEYKQDDILSVIPTLLLEEAQALQITSQRPHPGIIGYHGCRVRRGRITGLVLDKHPWDLKEYVREEAGPPLDKTAFMAALEDAVGHLHSSGLAHNDINPANVLVSATGTPVLVDLGSCRELGRKLGTSRGTLGWIEGDPLEYDTSEERHDWYAVEKIRAWLDNPTWDG